MDKMDVVYSITANNIIIQRSNYDTQKRAANGEEKTIQFINEIERYLEN
jgi:hypothetical protein